MWSQIKSYFEKAPARLEIAKLMLELGLSVSGDGSIRCGPIEIPASSIARALGVDRRTVADAVKMILKNPILKEAYGKLRPAGPMIKDVAKLFGFGVVEVHVEDPRAVGIIARVTAIIAECGISIRQIFAEDPDLYPEPKLTVVTERGLPGDAITRLLKVPGVVKVTIY